MVHTALRFARRWMPAILGAALLIGMPGLATMDWLRNRPVTLPEPGGPYAVGRVSYDWSDAARLDTPGANGEPRKLNVWIWYPAEAAPDNQPAPYLPTVWSIARKIETGPGIVLMQNPARVSGHSLEGAALSPAQPAYPLLILQPGLGLALPDYTTLAETLASYGYIVAGSTPTGSANVVVFNDGQAVYATPDGNPLDTLPINQVRDQLNRLVKVWAGDIRFILDQMATLNRADPEGRFRNRVNLSAVGAFGHSFGGAAAAEFCAQDARCDGGADLDGYLYGDVLQTGLSQPFLFIWSEPLNPADKTWQQAMREVRALFERLPTGSMQITIDGARHFNFSDYAVEYQPLLHALGLLGEIDGAHGLAVTTGYLRQFFDNILK